jgi:hypothetical protein
MISIRKADAADAQAIGAVFDAAVREGWTYLGELARQPIFPPEEWDRVVVEHAPPIAVYEAAGYRRDGTVRESDFRGVRQREPRFVKGLLGVR